MRWLVGGHMVNVTPVSPGLCEAGGRFKFVSDVGHF